MEDPQLQNAKQEAILEDSLKPNTKNNLTSFFQNSPLKWVNFDIERDKSKTRDSI